MDLLWYLQAPVRLPIHSTSSKMSILFLFSALMESSGVGTVTSDLRLLFPSGCVCDWDNPSQSQPLEELCLSDEPLGAAGTDVLEVGEIPEVGQRPASPPTVVGSDTLGSAAGSGRGSGVVRAR